MHGILSSARVRVPLTVLTQPLARIVDYHFRRARVKPVSVAEGGRNGGLLVWGGGLFCDAKFNLRRMIDAHRESRADATVLVRAGGEIDGSDVVSLNETAGTISAFQRDPLSNGAWPISWRFASMPLVVFNAEVGALIVEAARPEGALPFELVSQWLKSNAGHNGTRVRAWIVSEGEVYAREIITHEHFRRVNIDAAGGRVRLPYWCKSGTRDVSSFEKSVPRWDAREPINVDMFNEDRTAVLALIEARYGGFIESYLSRRLNGKYDKSVLLDLKQEIYLKLLSQKTSLKPPLLSTILQYANYCLLAYKRQCHFEELVKHDYDREPADTSLHSRGGPEDIPNDISSAEMRELVIAGSADSSPVWNRFSKRERELIAHFIRGGSRQELARKWMITPGQVSDIKTRVRRKIETLEVGPRESQLRALMIKSVHALRDEVAVDEVRKSIREMSRRRNLAEKPITLPQLARYMKRSRRALAQLISSHPEETIPAEAVLRFSNYPRFRRLAADHVGRRLRLAIERARTDGRKKLSLTLFPELYLGSNKDLLVLWLNGAYGEEVRKTVRGIVAENADVVCSYAPLSAD